MDGWVAHLEAGIESSSSWLTLTESVGPKSSFFNTILIYFTKVTFVVALGGLCLGVFLSDGVVASLVCSILSTLDQCSSFEIPTPRPVVTTIIKDWILVAVSSPTINDCTVSVLSLVSSNGIALSDSSTNHTRHSIDEGHISLSLYNGHLKLCQVSTTLIHF